MFGKGGLLFAAQILIPKNQRDMLVERVIQQPHDLPIEWLADIEAANFRANMLRKRGNCEAVGSDCRVHLLTLVLRFRRS